MFDLITEMMAAWGALGVGFIMLAENVFPPIPSEIVMPLAGFLVAQGKLTLIGTLIAAVLGCAGGALFWYWIGAKLGQERVLRLVDRYGRWLTMSRDDVERAFALFDRHQGKAIFFARMLPGARTLISVPAGMAGMPIVRFVGLTMLGSLIWVAMLLVAGYLLEANYGAVAGVVNAVGNALLIAVVAVYVWRVIRWKPV